MSIESVLEADLDWRAAELAALRIQVATAPSGSLQESAGLRAIWIMLYAHYEGFCKYAIDVYLDTLEGEGLQRSVCNDVIARFSLEKRFRDFRSDTASSSCWNFFTAALPAALTDQLRFEVRPQTKSNLWPSLLRENCDAVGLSITTLNEQESKLKTLVGRRNDIAHGQKNVIRNLPEYKKYEDAAFTVLYALALDISEAVASRRHVRATLPA